MPATITTKAANAAATLCRPLQAKDLGASTLVGKSLRSASDEVSTDDSFVTVTAGVASVVLVPGRTCVSEYSSTAESLIKTIPSTRQNFSDSSVSTRLHWGQRFIFCKTSVSWRSFLTKNHTNAN